MNNLLGGQIGLEDFIFAHLKEIESQKNYIKNNTSIGNGMQTVKFNNHGQARVETAHDNAVEKAMAKINSLLESFLEISDTALAMQIWEMGEDKSNPIEMTELIESSELKEFNFNEDFIFDAWGIISDAKAGRFFN